MVYTRICYYCGTSGQVAERKSAFCLGGGQQNSFDVLHKALSLAPVLAYPNFDKEFVVQTDALLTAVGAVLLQIGADGQEHPVAYVSKVLNKHECNYSFTKRECLTVIYAVKQFWVYV